LNGFIYYVTLIVVKLDINSAKIFTHIELI
jgi:hypothetical protein